MDRPYTEDSKDAWQEVQDLATELAKLTQSSIELAEFLDYVLRRVSAVIGAAAGAVWLNRGGQLRVEAESGEFNELVSVADRGRQCEDVTESGRISSRSFQTPGGQTAILIAAPLVLEQPVGVLQFALFEEQRADSNVHLLELVGGLVCDYLRRLELHRLRDSQQLAVGHEQLALRVHSQLNLQATAYEVVNEGRLFLGSDRVTLVLHQKRRFQVLAVSGAQDIEPRSSRIKALAKLASRVADLGKAATYRNSTEPPSLFEEYLAHEPASSIEAAPLKPTRVEIPAEGRGIIGVLISESFSEDSVACPKKWEVLVRHTELALSNALEHASIPFPRFQRVTGKIMQAAAARPIRTLIRLGVLALVVAILTLVKTDFDVVAEGKLQPEIRREIFAPADGQMLNLSVDHDSAVGAGDVVLELQSPSMDLEFGRLDGEHEAVVKRLQAINAARVQLDSRSVETALRLQQLSAEREELKQRRLSLQKQLAMLSDERRRLKVRSPISGQVITWDLKQRLLSRPVKRGQALLSVANTKGPWEAEVWIPSAKLRWIQRYHESNGPLSVSVALTSDPSVTYTGVLKRLPLRAEVGDDGSPGVWVEIELEEQVRGLHPGASITTKLHCGRRSLGYVWLAGAIEKVRAWWLF